MEKMFEKKSLILEYINEEDCANICKQGLFNCCSCDNLEDCYVNAKIEKNNEDNNVFAEAINYGGYESEEEFWNELLE